MHREKWNARYAASPLVWSAGPNGLFAEQVGELAPGRALDVGCGEGRNAVWLAERGWRVTAVDISDTGIDKARAISRERILEVNWVRADVADPAEWVAIESAAPFDLVACVFMHTDPASRSRWLPAAIDLVAPGGTFVYIGHDRSNIDHGVGGPQDPNLLLTPEDLVDLLAAGGAEFEIECAQVYSRAAGADPGHGGAADGQAALDTLVRARRAPLSG